MAVFLCLLVAAGLFILGLAGRAQAAPPEGALPELPPGLRVAREVQGRAQAALLAREGIVGVGLGETPSGRPVLQIFLARPGIAGLPVSLEGIPIERLVTGRFRSGELAAQLEVSSPRERWPRPVPIGVSIGHQDVTAGTLGCQVWVSGGCHTDYYILSNNHVLANENLALSYDSIIQPGSFDGGTYPADALGALTDWEPIEFSTSASNIMDAAIALTLPLVTGVSTPPDGYGQPRVQPQSPVLNLAVQKYGRTTQLTTGKIIALNATLYVDYSSGTARFVSQFIVTGDNNAPFSQPGDSGSLVVGRGGTADRRPVGLLFAGAGNYSVASPMGPILSRFNVNVSGE